MTLTRRQRELLYELAANRAHISLDPEGKYYIGQLRVNAGAVARLLAQGCIGEVWRTPEKDVVTGTFYKYEITDLGKQALKEGTTSPQKAKSKKPHKKPSKAKKRRKSVGRRSFAWHDKHDPLIISERKEGRKVKDIARDHKTSTKTVREVLRDVGLVKEYRVYKTDW